MASVDWLAPDKIESVLSLTADMRRLMPKITAALCKLPVNEDDPFTVDDPFGPRKTNYCDQKEVEEVLQVEFLPVLYESHDQIARGYREIDPIPEKWFHEDERVVRAVVAITLDLGLLCPVFTAARIALDLLADSEIDSFRTGAMLSLLYYGYQHTKLKDIHLYDLLESNIIFDIPLQMYQVILPGLAPLIVQDEICLELSKGWFNRFGFNFGNSAYKKTEMAIQLASLGVFTPAIFLECIYSRSEWNQLDNPYYQAFRIRGLKAGAKLLGSNPEAVDYYISKIKEKEVQAKQAVETWLNAITYLDSEQTSPELFIRLLEVPEALYHATFPLFYGIAVERLIPFANEGKLKEITRHWLLSQLQHENKNIIKITLENMGKLKPVEDGFKEQLLALMESEKMITYDLSSSRILEFAMNLLVIWQVREVIPILQQMVENINNSDYGLRFHAELAEKALQKLNAPPQKEE